MPLRAAALMSTTEQRVFHLNIRSEQIADTVILVGDPDRVAMVSQCFDQLDHQQQHREFIVHTGRIGLCPISVVSTGIGTDNIDIVVNELDALVNIDLATGEIKTPLHKLRLIRLGTTGSLQANIPIDSIVNSQYAIDLTGLLGYYADADTLNNHELSSAFAQHMHGHLPNQALSSIAASPALQQLFTPLGKMGITVTCDGFYAPQGRLLRANLAYPNWLERLQQFRFDQLAITNLEMETAGLFGLGELLGHDCCSLSLVVANRALDQVSGDMEVGLQGLIESVLGILTTKT